MASDWVPRPARPIALAASAVLGLLVSAGEAGAVQESLTALTSRLASISAVTGYEQAAVDTVLRLLPRAERDRFGNARLDLGGGTARRLLVCPLDEPGYVVGNLRADGYLTLRRVPGRVSSRFDQQIEGQRVTILGRRSAVPGVVAVRSIHLTRGREVPQTSFTVDEAYVDVGTESSAETARLGIQVLSPVTLTKRPHRYGAGLLAAPMAGRRAACAAMLVALREATRRAKLIPPLMAAFVVEQELSQRGLAGLATVAQPFTETLIIDGRPGALGSIERTAGLETARRFPTLGTVSSWTLPVRHAGTAVETVSLADADSLRGALVRWIGADQ